MFFHILLHIGSMVRDALFTKETTTVFCYEQIVFYTYAAEITIFLYHVKIQEILAMAFRFPIIYKRRNEDIPGSSVMTKPSSKRLPIRRQFVPNCSRLGRVSLSKPT